jgi:hypothetical protein
LSIFRLSVDKFQVPLICAENSGTVRETKPVCICDNIMLNSSYSDKGLSEVEEKISIHVLCSITFFLIVPFMR